MQFEFTMEDIQLIGAALGKLPFEQVAPLMQKMAPTVNAEVARLTTEQEGKSGSGDNVRQLQQAIPTKA